MWTHAAALILVQAANIPAGEYQKSCKGCYVEDTVLHCKRCEQKFLKGGRTDHRTKSTSVNITECVGAEIINDWGTLRCPKLRTPHAVDLPLGSYQRSCYDCSVGDERVLRCRECFLDDGTLVPSSVSTEGCSMFGFNDDTEALYCESKDEL